MLNSFPVTTVVAAVLGFLSGLGIGGGSLLVLWLTVILDTAPQVARSINLLFFIPSALVSCILRIKKRELHIRPLLPVIAAGSLASALFSWFSTVVDVAILKKGFGIILIVAGLREISCSIKKKGSSY